MNRDLKSRREICSVTLRYRLRTLLVLLAILPPLLWIGWTKYEAWRVEREQQRQIEIALEWIQTQQPQPLSVPQAEPIR